MALRDQPYIPLYVQDYLTDEALNECSASTQGIYVKIMCVMHKSKEYGTILLRQKDKQSDQQILNFAMKLARHLTFPTNEIQEALEELLEQGVLVLNGDTIIQKRMVKDNTISLVRSKAGSRGGFATAKNTANHKAKGVANSENENENENENNINKRVEKFSEIVRGFHKYRHIHDEFISYWTEPNRSKTKVRFEMEKTWDTKRRLSTWEKRSGQFKKEGKVQTYRNPSMTEEELLKKYGPSPDYSKVKIGSDGPQKIGSKMKEILNK